MTISFFRKNWGKSLEKVMQQIETWQLFVESEYNGRVDVREGYYDEFRAEELAEYEKLIQLANDVIANLQAVQEFWFNDDFPENFDSFDSFANEVKKFLQTELQIRIDTQIADIQAAYDAGQRGKGSMLNFFKHHIISLKSIVNKL